MVYQRIKYFLKAAQTGSFSKAAGEKYVSPQALAKQIVQLEEELGGRLFDRSPQGVVLTRLGEYAFHKFSKIDHDLNHAVEELKVLAMNDKERITVGIFSALPQETLVTPIISLLLASFPNYQIGLELINLHEGRKLLQERKIDLLLTNTHEQDDWSGYRRMSFGEYETKVIVSLRHPWALKEKITAEDMRQEMFLKMKMDTSIYTVPLKQSFYENIPCRCVQKVSNFDTLFTLLQQGKAFAVFPMAFIHMDVAKIKCFDYPDRKFLFHTALIYNPQNGLSGLDKVVAELTDEFDLREL